MPSIAVHKATVGVTASTNKGVVTLTTLTGIFAGANANLYKTDGSVVYRVKILAILDTTAKTISVRRYPNVQDSSGVTYDNDHVFQGNYGFSDVSAIGTGFISMEAQSVPVDPAFSQRVLP